MNDRATWRLGALMPGVALNAQIILLILAVIRGLDYGTGESEDTARRLGAVEMAAPMWLWGLLFTSAASAVFIAIAWRWAAGITAGHAALSALYGAIGVGIVIDVWERAESSNGQFGYLLTIPAVTVIAVLWGVKKYPHQFAPAVIVGVFLALTLGALTISLDGLRSATILIGLASIHALIAVNTAQLAAQDNIRRERGSMWKQP